MDDRHARTDHPTHDGEPVAEVIGLLRQASVALDSVWRAALSGRSGDAVIRLGEASHGVHRARIALTSADTPDVRPIRAALSA